MTDANLAVAMLRSQTSEQGTVDHFCSKLGIIPKQFEDKIEFSVPTKDPKLPFIKTCFHGLIVKTSSFNPITRTDRRLINLYFDGSRWCISYEGFPEMLEHYHGGIRARFISKFGGKNIIDFESRFPKIFSNPVFYSIAKQHCFQFRLCKYTGQLYFLKAVDVSGNTMVTRDQILHIFSNVNNVDLKNWRKSDAGL